jgi:hypothetical protein
MDADEAEALRPADERLDAMARAMDAERAELDSRAGELAASLARWEQRRDVEALIEAGKLYGSDIEAELKAVAAGTHPVQLREQARQR